jgi:PleD family two-component response regulator
MARHPGHVLIYDSHPAALARRLAALGYTVRPVARQAELERYARQERPDALVGDLATGGSTPVAVCRRFKANLRLRYLPILVLTRGEDVSRRVTIVDSGADEVLPVSVDDAELGAHLHRAIERAHASLDANPLTGLPGNTAIKAELTERLGREAPFAALFIDLDNFKAFNDRYGFERGDRVLGLLGNILLEILGHAPGGHPPDFAGHIGGDDFVLFTTPDRAEPYARRICTLLDRRVPQFYDAADRRTGGIVSTDRQGREQRFPFVSVSVAIVTNEERGFSHPGEVAQVGAEIKHHLKQLPGSRFLRDRRGGGPSAPVDPPLLPAVAKFGREPHGVQA